MKKKIILGLPRSFDMYKRIIQNLEFHHFEVIDISYDEHGFKIKKLKDKIIHAFRKIILKDYDYKSQLKIKPHENEILNKLNAIEGQADFSLIIRSDIYPLSIIKKIKQKTRKMVGYQWDGLHRFPAIYKHIALYDKFYVFDEMDKNYPNVQLIHNFYFDNDVEFTTEIKQDFFFIGTYMEKRMPKINRLLEVLDHLNMTYQVKLLTNKTLNLDNKKIEVTNQIINNEDYLKVLKSSKICLDFLNDTHQGLSFRTFEALCYDKKLITNNASIKHYDFYHPNNIFIWDNNDDDLKSFLSLPYQTIESSIKQKYSFGRWIENILK
jgi:hypothetical protein